MMWEKTWELGRAARPEKAEDWALVARVVTGPTVEPVSRTEAKLHLRVDHASEDALIDELIAAARQHVENVAWRALCTQTLEVELPGWPRERWVMLPRPPLQSVVSVKYVDPEGAVQTLGSGVYVADTVWGRMRLGYGQSWPGARGGEPVTVRYVAGYGAAADVPALLRRAALLLVGHWYENREAVVVAAGTVATALPLAVDSILWQFRAE